MVLRRTPWREHDLLVDLLTPGGGRLTVNARGARRSSKRFGASLEPGARIRAHLSQGRGRGTSLTAADLVAAVRAPRADLDRFHQLAYVLEVARLSSSEGEADEGLFALVVSFLDHLEANPATPEALVHWELTVLAHLGYALQLGPCMVTGGPSDALSLAAGGAVTARAPVNDALPVGADGVQALARLVEGQGGLIPARRQRAVRAALVRIWGQVVGRDLRSARFLMGEV